jgi:hypothetical protein
MTLSLEDARVYAGGFEIFPDYPRDSFARELVAIIIVRECETHEEALELTLAMSRNFERWPGPAVLTKFAQEIRQPVVKLQEWKSPAKPTDLCPSCASNGFLPVNHGRGGFVRCPACKNGEDLPQNLLDIMNTPAEKREQTIEDKIRDTIETSRRLRSSEYTGRRSDSE